MTHQFRPRRFSVAHGATAFIASLFALSLVPLGASVAAPLDQDTNDLSISEQLESANTSGETSSTLVAPVAPESTDQQSAAENESQPAATNSADEQRPLAWPVGDYLEFRKQINSAPDEQQFRPGESFVYNLLPTCNQFDCTGTVIEDEFPAELEGFEILKVEGSPGPNTVPLVSEWFQNGEPVATQPTHFTANTSVRLATEAPLGDGQVGLPAGKSFAVNITVRVPDNFDISDPRNDQPIVNTACAKAENTWKQTDRNDGKVCSSMSFVPHVDKKVVVAASKSWSAAESVLGSPAEVFVNLSAENRSNVAADSLTIQEPNVLATSRTALNNQNPFEVFDLVDLQCTAPTGATPTVDAWVFDNAGTGSWVTGAGGCQLPDGVAAADVAGLRITYTGTPANDAIAKTAIAKNTLTLQQRTEKRSDGSTLPVNADQLIDNTVLASISKSGLTGKEIAISTLSNTARATHKVKALPLAVDATKSFDITSLLPGGNTSGTITAQNTGAKATKLVVEDKGFFADNGFKLDAVRSTETPVGTTSASIVFLPSLEEQALSGTSATPPADTTGFVVTYLGDFDENAQAAVGFDVSTTTAFKNVTRINTASVTVSDGLRYKTVSPTAQLKTLNPSLTVKVKKEINPDVSTPVRPGRTVNASIKSELDANLVNVKRLIIGDTWDGKAKTFWDAFDLYSIGRTEVYLGETMLVQVTTDQENWETIATVNAATEATVFEADNAALATMLPSTTSLSDVTGVRFVFTNDTSLSARSVDTTQIGFKARQTLRSDVSQKTHPEVTEGVAPVASAEYKNTVVVTANGTTDAGAEYSSNQSSNSGAKIIGTPIGSGGGTFVPTDPSVGTIDKHWSQASVVTQSQSQATTTLRWRVESGFSSAEIADAGTDLDGNPSAPAQTTFDAFNLVRLQPIPASDVVGSSGWALKYDKIEKIELFDGTSWNTVTPPMNGWVSNGAFAGYTLTPAEQQSTQSVRITVIPDDDARQAATSPTAPEPGTGVTSSKTAYRDFKLDWQLRNKKRSVLSGGSSWVNATSQFNSPVPGLVDNTASLRVLKDGTPSLLQDFAGISIVDGPLSADVSISALTSSLVVPSLGSASADQYPTRDYTLTGWTTSVAKAQQFRMTWPTPTSSMGDCLTDTDDPFALPASCLWTKESLDSNPLNRMEITSLNLASTPSEIDLAETKVQLYRYVNGEIQLSETVAGEALSSVDWTNVVGVSVIFAGANAEELGGTISQNTKMSIKAGTRVRETPLDGSEREYIANKTIQKTHGVIVQPYNATLGLHSTDKVGDYAGCGVTFTGGNIDATLVKTIGGYSGITILEKDRDTARTVKLVAKHGTSTAPAKRVELKDIETSGFWSTFRVSAFPVSGIALPAGADRLTVKYLGDFGSGDGFVENSCSASDLSLCMLAAEELDRVRGMEFVFDRADGKAFSTDKVWDASVQFDVKVRTEIDFSGTRQSFVNIATVQSTGEVINQDGVEAQSILKPASASIVLDPGTASVQIGNQANDGDNTVRVGELFPLDLTVKNNGTGYLDVDALQVVLPQYLKYTGNAPTGKHPVEFTADPNGAITQVPTLENHEGSTLVLTWPENSSRMKPGETLKLRIYVVMDAGLINGQVAEVEATVTTAQKLTSCSLYSPNGGPGYLGTNNAKRPDGTTNACATVDRIGPTSGPNFYLTKAVLGHEQTAVNQLDSSAGCQATIDSDGKKFYQAPCVTRTRIGGQDQWVLRLANGGTNRVYEAQVFDELPADADQFMIHSNTGPIPRGSNFRPHLSTAPEVKGATSAVSATTKYSTVANACSGTWDSVETSEPCPNANWQETAAFDDVTALRVDLDFGDEGLAPGQTVDIHFTTTNKLAASGPSVTQNQTNQAWNQAGIRYFDSDIAQVSSQPVSASARAITAPETWQRIASGPVGMSTSTGSIIVEKHTEGLADQFAQGKSFTMNLSCSVDDGDGPVEVALDPADSEFSLHAGENRQIDGIPLGAVCTVTEPRDHGQTSSAISDPVTVAVSTLDDFNEVQEVPADQVITVTNTYDYGVLTVSKSVETTATKDDQRTRKYGFALSCQTSDSVPIELGESASFSIASGESFHVEEQLPVGAVCELSEVDSDRADTVAFTGDNVAATGEGSARIVIGRNGTDVSAVTVTNRFAAGTFTVRKLTEGEGRDKYGDQAFNFSATCKRDGETLLDEAFELHADQSASFGMFPSGTECQAVETDAEGATETRMSTPDAVTIRSGQDSEVTVTATNIFRVGDLQVVKDRVGPAAAAYGDGPFTAIVSCQYDDGDGDAPDVFDPVTLELNAGNNYRSTVYDLPVGTECGVVEQNTGGGVPVGSPESATITEDPDGAPPATVVTLKNNFPGGYVQVTKEVDGSAASSHMDDAFRFKSTCTWPQGTGTAGSGGSDVVEFSLKSGQAKQLGIYPADTVCQIEEIDAGGADRSKLSEGGKVTVRGMDDNSASLAQVTATNTFELPSGRLENTGFGGKHIAGFAAIVLIGGAALFFFSRRRS